MATDTTNRKYGKAETDYKAIVTTTVSTLNRKMGKPSVEVDAIMFRKPEQQKPTIRQTLMAAILLSVLAVLLLGVGMGLKLTYGPSLYFQDQYFGLAALGLTFVAVSIPIGVTAICLINVICRVRAHIHYTEARKRELESRVADVYVPEVPLKN
ncbi:hypothetical protein P879_10281 [Paragonimus westermani]|uniref:Uncharacterized protein n=1 Tax=Paragonimus westermani TaxID=34504 RepID=A0A8T0D5H8_9TREM|nr:hypothetical protein P879_10281 [Paragonimus westermani]